SGRTDPLQSVARWHRRGRTDRVVADADAIGGRCRAAGRAGRQPAGEWTGDVVPGAGLIIRDHFYKSKKNVAWNATYHRLHLFVSVRWVSTLWSSCYPGQRR